jgi:hypothetical protein
VAQLSDDGPGSSPGPHVELLCWSECPSHEHAGKILHDALAELGYDPGIVTSTWVEDDDMAAEQRFVGSPTFRVSGADLFPIAPGEGYGLTCRIYTRRNGRPSPLPDPEDLRDALRTALGPKEMVPS